MSYFGRMRAVKNVVAVLAVFALAGCAQASMPPIAPSASSTTKDQSFAARSVWNAYFKVSGQVLSDASVDISITRPYLTQSRYGVVKKQVENFRQSGLTLEGQLQSRGFRVAGDKAGVVTAFVCVDNSRSQLVNEKAEIVPDTRAKRYTLRLLLVQESGVLRISEDKEWNTESAC